MKTKNPDEQALADKRPRVLMEDPVYGAVVSKTVTKPLAGALDESLLGTVLARRPRRLSDVLPAARIVSMPRRVFQS
jgi:hypothetical protein